MTTKNTYFDPETMTVGNLTDNGDEVWFNSSDGVVSRVVEEGETLIPFALYVSFVNQMKASLPAQYSDRVPTTSDQQSDSIRPTSDQHSDRVPTAFDTSKARDAKRPPRTAKEIVKDNPEVVMMLKERKTIRTLSKGVYKSYKDLPTWTPQYIVDEINKRGIKRADGRPHTVDTVSPIVAAMKIQSRPTVWRVCYLILLTAVIAVIVTKVWFWFTVPDGISTDTDTEQTNKTNQIKVDRDLILIVCNENKITLTDFRINLILQKTYADRAALVAEVKTQYAAMLNAMKK